MMTRGSSASNIDKRIKKIEKSEEKGLKILYKQRKELSRSVFTFLLSEMKIE